MSIIAYSLGFRCALLWRNGFFYLEPDVDVDLDRNLVLNERSGEEKRREEKSLGGLAWLSFFSAFTRWPYFF